MQDTVMKLCWCVVEIKIKAESKDGCVFSCNNVVMNNNIFTDQGMCAVWFIEVSCTNLQTGEDCWV